MSTDTRIHVLENEMEKMDGFFSENKRSIENRRTQCLHTGSVGFA